MGAGYTASDSKYEYYLQPQDNGFVVYDIKNPPEYRGMLQKQRDQQSNSKSNIQNNLQNYSSNLQKDSGAFNKFRNYNEADITPEEWKETREQFLKIALRFVLIVSIIILAILYFIFKQAGSEQSLKQILYLIIVTLIIFSVSVFSDSKLFKNLEKFIHTYWDEPNDYKKWLNEKMKD